MDKKIICQKCNFNYIYFLLYFLTTVIISIIDNYLEPDSIKEKKYNNKYVCINHQILEVFIFNISDFLAIIPYFISKKLTLSNNEDNKKEERDTYTEKRTNTEDTEHLELIYNDFKQTEKEKRRKKVIFYLILIASFDFLKDFIFVLYYAIFKVEYKIFRLNFTSILDIIFQFIFSYLILETHFYKLQKCSLYLNIGLLAIILILDILDIKEFKLIKSPIFFFIPFHLVFFSLDYIFGKKLISYGYVTIYLIIIMKGAIKFIINLVFSISLLIFERDLFKNFALYFRETKYILLIIGKIITHFFGELFLWIIIDRFSPNHTPLTIIGDEFIYFFLELAKPKDNNNEVRENASDDTDKEPTFGNMKNYKYIRIIIYIFSLIGVILHNEIVVINICGLGSDTKYFLDIMVKNDEEYSNADNPNILKRFETIEMLDLDDDDENLVN